MSIQPGRPIDYLRAQNREEPWAERSAPVLDDHDLCGVPLVGRRYLKCGLGRPNDIRVLRGPFEERRDRPLERPAQIGEGVFDSQSSRCKHRSRYKAALLQAPQTLNQALLRKTRNVAADSVEPPPVAVIAQ